MKFYAVITAAGMSKRMGTFKPLMPYGDSTIIGHLSSKFSKVCGSDKRVIIVTGNRRADLEASLSDRNFNFVFNNQYDKSDMFASVCLGLREVMKISGEHKYSVFIIPGDMPAVSYDTLKLMCMKMEETEADIVYPRVYGKRKHPLLINGRCINEVVCYRGEGGLKEAVKLILIKEDYVDVLDEGCMIDADTPEDYAKLLKYVEPIA